jgi:uncharacterized membrane protein (DUF373 family)
MVASEPLLWQNLTGQRKTIEEPIMAPQTAETSGWRKYCTYSQFERIALACIMFMIAIIAVVAIVFTGVKIVSDILLGETFIDKAALQDTLQLILTILILLEFNHSVFVALTERSGAIQVRMLIRITILVVARKLMLIDFTAANANILLGFGGLLLALGGLHWLISTGDRQRPTWSTADHSAGNGN